MKSLICLLWVCISAVAQTTTPAPTPVCPSFYGTGADYNSAASPKVGGWAVVATLAPGIKCNPANLFQLYSFSEYSVAAVKTGGTFAVQENTTTGFAIPLKQLGPFDLFALGNVGMSVTPSTTAVATTITKLATTYGVVGVSKTIPKIGLKFIGAVQWVNGQRTLWAGFGRTF